MHIITLAAQKGGVGKTTLAVNLAVAAQAAGIRTALFDLDPQESATAWSERREAELPHVEPISARRLNQAIDAAEANSAYRAAWPYGLGVTEHEPNGKAAQEIASLRQFLFDELQNCTPANVKA